MPVIEKVRHFTSLVCLGDPLSPKSSIFVMDSSRADASNTVRRDSRAARMRKDMKFLASKCIRIQLTLSAGGGRIGGMAFGSTRGHQVSFRPQFMVGSTSASMPAHPLTGDAVSCRLSSESHRRRRLRASAASMTIVEEVISSLAKVTASSRGE
jgi:hypothetical protein